MCVGIVWMEILSEKRFSSMTRTKIHFWRTDLTIDLIIVEPELKNKLKGTEGYNGAKSANDVAKLLNMI